MRRSSRSGARKRRAHGFSETPRLWPLPPSLQGTVSPRTPTRQRPGQTLHPVLRSGSRPRPRRN
ncbi:unnamed protein product [Ixodes pacificus]